MGTTTPSIPPDFMKFWGHLEVPLAKTCGAEETKVYMVMVEAYFDAINANVVTGWAFDHAAPTKRQEVQVFVDDVLVQSGLAESFREDLREAGKGDGACSFLIELPPEVCDGTERKISVRLADTGEELPGSPRIFLSSADWGEPAGGGGNATAQQFEGMFDAVKNGVALGWAYNPDDPARRLEVEVLEGERVVACGLADQYREDLLVAGKGDGKCGFSIELPEEMGGSGKASLSVRVAGKFLDGSPKTCHLPLKRAWLNADIGRLADKGYCGHLDVLGEGGVIVGWVLSADMNQAPIMLDVHVNGIYVDTVATRLFRDDISKILGRPVTPGFRIELQSLEVSPALMPQGGGEVEVWIQIRGTELAFAPFLVDSEGLGAPKVLPIGPADEARLAAVVRQEAPVPGYGDRRDEGIRLIAFYLPQFHPIPENDEWWGRGFTEWSNVTQAKPLFEGHYQPRIPADLGYYDLRAVEVMRAQTDMARQYGIHGFCFHYYWFGGRRLLELPLDNYLASDIDFPFCICWANEPWSRRWDGSEHDVLMPQPHTLESDIRIAQDWVELVKDPRYIRVNGAPIILVYRASLMEDTVATTRAWRQVFAQHGVEEVHLCMVESFGQSDPERFGFDAAMEFPPHKSVSTLVNEEMEGLAEGYSGNIYDYRQVVDNAINHHLIWGDWNYLLYRGLFPSWDNTPRKGLAGNVFHHGTPALYEIWLRGLIEYTLNSRPRDNRIIFINAWNEWAEGAHLEPDLRYGRQYLEATLRALQGAHTAEEALEHARLRLTRVCPECLKWLDEINAHLLAAHRSVEFLSERMRLQLDMTMVQLDEIPEEVGQSRNIENLMLILDSICGRPFKEVGDNRIMRGQRLNLIGWCYVPRKSGAWDDPLYLELQRVGSDFRAFYVTMNRIERPDVVKANPMLCGTPWAGFNFSIPTRELPPGHYRMVFRAPAADGQSCHIAQLDQGLLHVL